MANFIKLTINDKIYYVSEPWAAIIEALVSKASQDAGEDSMVDVFLTNNGSRRIAVIKEVMSLTGLNLRDAKYLSDKAIGEGQAHLGRFHISELSRIAECFEEAGGAIRPKSALELLALQAD